MSDFIKLIPKKQSGGNVLSQKDKDRLWEFRDKFGADDTKEKYFDYWDFQKGDEDLKKYFSSYLNSQGFNRIIDNQNKWWKDRHPYKKWFSSPDPGNITDKWFTQAKNINPSVYTMDTYPDLSFANYPKRMVFIGRGRSNYLDEKFPYPFVAGHEYLHGINPILTIGYGPNRKMAGIKHFNYRSAQAQALAQKPTRIPDKEEWEKHDSKQEERHADVWGLKYLFYKEGIYDSRSNKDITIQQVQKLRKKFPKLRPFQQMTDKQIMFMMNHVAENSDNRELPINYLPTT